MPSNATKKRFKKKLRSCAMCKPHKMNWSDKRTRQQVKADVALDQQLRET